MESHDTEFREGVTLYPKGEKLAIDSLTSPKSKKKEPFQRVDGTDLFTIEQVRAMAEMMHTMRIVSIKHNFSGLPSKQGSVHVDYIDEDGDEQSRIFWRQNQ